MNGHTPLPRTAYITSDPAGGTSVKETCPSTPATKSPGPGPCGIGFESGGLAVAHSIAQGLTVVPSVRQSYLHGEMVAIGLIAQLVAEKETEEARKAAEFFAAVGLPVHLGQVSLSPRDKAELSDVVEAAMLMPFVHNEPFEVTPERLRADMLQAHELGVLVAESAGDAAYRALRAD